MKLSKEEIARRQQNRKTDPVLPRMEKMQPGQIETWDISRKLIVQVSAVYLRKYAGWNLCTSTLDDKVYVKRIS